MANSYWDVYRDSWVSQQNNANNFGSGLGLRLQSGYSSGTDDYENRFFIGWLKPAGIPNDATITAVTAFLKVRGNPGGACFSQGGSPKLLVERVANESYVPKENGTSGGECSLGSGDGGDGTAIWPGPSTTGTGNKAFWQGTPSGGDVISIVITNQFKDWWAARATSDNYYTAVFKPSNAAGTAEEQITARRIAFHSADVDSAIFNGGVGPYLLVEYSTATAPNAPTLTNPTSGARVTGQYRILNFTYTHPSGTAGTDYRVQVSTNVGMSALVVDKTVVDAMVNNEAMAVNLDDVTDFEPNEARGTTYYWRVQTKGDGQWSAWSAVRSYIVNRVPTMTHVWPS